LWGALSDERSGLSFVSQEWEKNASYRKVIRYRGSVRTNRSKERKFKAIRHFTKTKRREETGVENYQEAERAQRESGKRKSMQFKGPFKGTMNRK
jgi:hypothetical protein